MTLDESLQARRGAGRRTGGQVGGHGAVAYVAGGRGRAGQGKSAKSAQPAVFLMKPFRVPPGRPVKITCSRQGLHREGGKKKEGDETREVGRASLEICHQRQQG